MGLKEGWDQGRKVAETVYRISSNFSDVHDPNLHEALRQSGVNREDISRLAIRPTLNPQEIAYTAAGIFFVLTHGTLWNSLDMHRW